MNKAEIDEARQQRENYNEMNEAVFSALKATDGLARQIKGPNFENNVRCVAHALSQVERWVVIAEVAAQRLRNELRATGVDDSQKPEGALEIASELADFTEKLLMEGLSEGSSACIKLEQYFDEADLEKNPLNEPPRW